MHKINTSTAVGGEFADGNPATGQKATELNASWFNTIQRELLAILTAAGVTPSISIDDQLSKVLALKSEIVWKTFLMSSAAIEVSSWTRNAVVIAGRWYDTMLYTGQTIKNSIMVVCPKWEVAGESVTSCTFTHAEDTSVPIYRGNLLFVVFDSDGLVAKSYSIPSSSDDSISILKSLIATKLNTTDLEVTGILTALSSGITLLKHLYVQKDVSVSSDFLFFSDDALTTNMGSFNHSTGLWILWQLLVVGNATVGGTLTVTGAASAASLTAVGAVAGDSGNFSSGVATKTASAPANVASCGLKTPVIYTADSSPIDLTTVVSSLGLPYGERFLVGNVGGSAITLNAKCLSTGGSEVNKSFSLDWGCVAEFIAYPSSAGAHAVFKVD